MNLLQLFVSFIFRTIFSFFSDFFFQTFFLHCVPSHSSKLPIQLFVTARAEPLLFKNITRMIKIISYCTASKKTHFNFDYFNENDKNGIIKISTNKLNSFCKHCSSQYVILSMKNYIASECRSHCPYTISIC